MFSPKWLGSLQDVPQRNAEVAGVRRRAGGDAGRRRRRGSRSGSARSSTSRTRRATATRFKAVRNPDYWRGPERHHRRGPARTSTGSTSSSPSTRTAGRTRSARATFDVMMTSMGDTISQFLDDDDFEVELVDEVRRHRLHHAERGHRRRRSRRARTPPARCSTSTAAGRWPGRSTRSGSPRSAAPASPRPPNGPFPPGSLGYLEDSGYPKFDVDAGAGRDGHVPRRAQDRPHRVQLQHDERPVQRRDRTR